MIVQFTTALSWKEVVITVSMSSVTGYAFKYRLL